MRSSKLMIYFFSTVFMQANLAGNGSIFSGPFFNPVGQFYEFLQAEPFRPLFKEGLIQQAVALNEGFHGVAEHLSPLAEGLLDHPTE